MKTKSYKNLRVLGNRLASICKAANISPAELSKLLFLSPKDKRRVIDHHVQCSRMYMRELLSAALKGKEDQSCKSSAASVSTKGISSHRRNVSRTKVAQDIHNGHSSMKRSLCHER